VTSGLGNGDVWLIKSDSLGNIIWEKCFGGSASDEHGSAICKTNDGGVVMAGLCTANNGQVTGWQGLQDIWVVKADSLGSFEWGKAIGGTQNDRAESIEQTPDGGFILAGGTVSNDGDVSVNLGSMDGWVVKLSPSGLGIKNPENDVMDFTILQGDNSLVTRFFSRKNEFMNLSVCNVEGKVVMQERIKVNTGANYFTLPLEHVPGMYIVSIEHGDFFTSEKFIIK
jgi:hypothetical protein